MRSEKQNFGYTAHGEQADLYRLSNNRGIDLAITNYGATLVELDVLDRNEKKADVVLGYDSLADYLNHNYYFGAVIGRYANRIAGSSFLLNDQQYHLAQNDGENHHDTRKLNSQQREQKMNKFFPELPETIPFEGPESKNPLAFKYYLATQVVGQKTMEEHLRFSVAYWHTFKATGIDPFGAPTFNRPWIKAETPLEMAELTLQAAFEFAQKLGVPFYCFHDRDLAPEGETFAESCKNLEIMVAQAKRLQEETGIKLLWGTANLFGHPRYAHGAATNPDAHVFAYAAAQVKHAMAATKELGGSGYVFWGGREGYETLLNTNMKREQEQLARFFHMAVDYAKKIGFEGQFLIEPKPKEPTKHQYDFDAATVLGFLRAYDLFDHFKLNIEANHATLAGHSFEHDLTVAAINGRLGSIDANVGDPLLGWDTDQFPTEPRMCTLAMLVVLNQGGLGKGGLNFDAKPRRGSFDETDLFYAHISGMDTFARGLLAANQIIEDGILNNFIEERYASYSEGLGKRIMSGEETFDSLKKYVIQEGEPALKSGRQEMLENILATYI